MPAKIYLVSACLLGINSRYDGGDNRSEKVLEFLKGRHAVPVCPEQLGGLPTPRRPAEICGGGGKEVLEGGAAVRCPDGTDVTEAFIRGAEQVLRIARLTGAREAILKSGSPSCGRGWIKDGSFTGSRRRGDGVTAALLLAKGCTIYDENSLPED
ncbi:MAG TPA: DUF523 domain-containing protein [Bacillota bacterium]|jgi:uncharacterized protein YbbK (DUF523 family)|nr:DUF523 domain-containing protein [Bacillota bacterium]HOP69636.1 DUF523 domain-containing protein [Bacillota bacterium]HPT33168.1 DUF523 domain-containing protein [Bacillota bacterium]HPZ65627.1 DUF523 domain-containing protein [Bacillota bacterium]HQD05573.1 DUF523 domain-containing protein [Bacillota bacterium]